MVLGIKPTVDFVSHHRFRLVDPEHGMEIPDFIEVHTVELTEYNLEEATISSAPEIEQWAFFFLFADRYEPERLRESLPGIELGKGGRALFPVRTLFPERPGGCFAEKSPDPFSQ